MAHTKGRLTIEDHHLHNNEQIVLFDGHPVAEVWKSKSGFSVETMLARWNAFEDGGAVALAIEILTGLERRHDPMDGLYKMIRKALTVLTEEAGK